MPPTLDTPLEQYDEKTYGSLDEDQLEFLATGAKDLILIENAGEQFRRFIMDSDNLEIVLKEIVGDKANIMLPAVIEEFDERELQSVREKVETYPDQTLTPEVVSFYLEYYNVENKLKITPKSALKVTDNMINFLKQKETDSMDEFIALNSGIDGDPNIPTVCLVGLNLMCEAGGHWAALLIDTSKNTVEYFDAMMINEAAGSAYTVNFVNIIRKNLPKMKYADGTPLVKENFMLVLPDSIPYSIFSLQTTGGFPDNKPVLYVKVLRHKREHEMFKKPPNAKIKSQHVDSQNHFCYMWAMWYISLRLHGLKLKDILQPSDLSNNVMDEFPVGSSVKIMKEWYNAVIKWHNEFIPLIVIKKFIFCLVTQNNHIHNLFRTFLSCKGNKDCWEYDFFKAHFMSVWHNKDSPISTKFARYNIQFKFNNKKDCFENSIGKDAFNNKLVKV